MFPGEIVPESGVSPYFVCLQHLLVRVPQHQRSHLPQNSRRLDSQLVQSHCTHCSSSNSVLTFDPGRTQDFANTYEYISVYPVCFPCYVPIYVDNPPIFGRSLAIQVPRILRCITK
uniref:Uncharacterized protein n=1 Tax=Cacopsylla melanoneura TaxID=428564 RepID=A0A8D8M2D9_9HEMI